MPMPKNINPGDIVRLREGSVPNARVREFRYVRMQKGKVVLSHEGEYEWETDAADIDWGGFRPPEDAG